MDDAILRMGYRATVRVAKSRRVADLAHCTLCVDDLEGVGGLLELERLAADDAPAGVVQDELAAFVSSLGVAAVRTDQTYDALVRASQEAPG
jgi:adenylate cyclase class 2